MDQSTTVSGRIIKLMGKAGWSTRMEIAIKETGLMTEHMEKEYIYMLMDLLTMETGRLTNNSD